MPSNDPAERRLNARIAADARWGKRTDDLADTRREIKADRLADHVKRMVDSWPPLTADQRDRIALLLRPGGAA